MLYIQESLAPGEKILKFSQYHIIYVLASLFGAVLFLGIAGVLLFIGIIYYYYDLVKVPPWLIFKAAAELSFGDYIKALWHINIIYRVAAIILILMAVIQVGSRMLVRMTTEMGVTTRRVVFKRGLVSRKVEEMRVDFIDGADVEQGVWGRILNFGGIKMYGTGVEGITFPSLMEDPVNFRRAVLSARAVQVGTNDSMPANPMSQASQGAQPVVDHTNTETRADVRKLKSEMPVTPTSRPVSAAELKDVSAPIDEEPKITL